MEWSDEEIEYVKKRYGWSDEEIGRRKEAWDRLNMKPVFEELLLKKAALSHPKLDAPGTAIPKRNWRASAYCRTVITSADVIEQQRKKSPFSASYVYYPFLEKLYDVWSSMNARCNDQSNMRYGGRGIRNEFSDFVCFYNWAMANDYEPGKDLHRLNNDGNYSPTSCVFLEHGEHMRLHRRTGS